MGLLTASMFFIGNGFDTKKDEVGMRMEDERVSPARGWLAETSWRGFWRGFFWRGCFRLGSLEGHCIEGF